MATYSAIRVSTTADTGLSITSGNTNTVSVVSSGQNYDFIQVTIDDTNDILTGRTSAGDVYVFESAAALTIALQT